MENCDSRHRHHSSPGLGPMKQSTRVCWPSTRINPCHSWRRRIFNSHYRRQRHLNVADRFVLLLRRRRFFSRFTLPSLVQSDIRSSTHSFLTTFGLRSSQPHQRFASRRHSTLSPCTIINPFLSCSGLPFCISRGALAFPHFQPVAYDISAASINACGQTPCLASASFVWLSFSRQHCRPFLHRMPPLAARASFVHRVRRVAHVSLRSL